jgi:PAS domain S-box-containing protein
MMHRPFRKTAVITGASRGLGRALAHGLAVRGVDLHLIGRHLETLDEVAAAARTRSSNIRCYRADLTLDKDLEELAKQLQADCRAVDYLIHCAGLISISPIERAHLDHFDQQFRANVRAPFALTQALLPLLRCAGGQIIFINSSVGIKGRANISQYAATKHALRAVADALRDEVNDEGVRVMSVFLGRTATDMQAAVHDLEGKTYRPELLIQPQEAAELVLHMLDTMQSAEVTDINIRPFRKHEPTRLAFSLVEDTILVRDWNGTIRFWSKGAERTYGWALHEAVEKKSHDLLRTEFPVPLQRIEEELLETGRWEGNLIHTCRDGSRLLLMSRWELQRDHRRKPAVVLELNIPLGPAGEARRYESRRHSPGEKPLRFGSWTWESQSNTAAWSDGLCRLYGLSPEEFSGNYEVLLDRIHPQDRQPTRSIATKAYQNRQPFILYHRVPDWDGTNRLLRVYGSVVADPAGEVTMFGAVYDVTEQVRLDDSLLVVENDQSSAEGQPEEDHEVLNRLHRSLRGETVQRRIMKMDREMVSEESEPLRSLEESECGLHALPERVQDLIQSLAERDRRISELETALRNARHAER